MSALIRDALKEAFPNDREDFLAAWMDIVCNSRQGNIACRDPRAIDVLLKFLERKISRIDVMQDIEQVIDKIESDEKCVGCCS